MRISRHPEFNQDQNSSHRRLRLCKRGIFSLTNCIKELINEGGKKKSTPLNMKICSLTIRISVPLSTMRCGGCYCLAARLYDFKEEPFTWSNSRWKIQDPSEGTSSHITTVPIHFAYLSSQGYFKANMRKTTTVKVQRRLVAKTMIDNEKKTPSESEPTSTIISQTNKGIS